MFLLTKLKSLSSINISHFSISSSCLVLKAIFNPEKSNILESCLLSPIETVLEIDTDNLLCNILTIEPLAIN